jgi:hypothetical protein
MSHDEQRNQQQKGQKGGVPTHTIDNNDDYFDFNPEVSRHRSKLRVLYHAATCPCDELSYCPAGVNHCCASKRVFAHIIICTAGNDCDVPGCQHSGRVWRHYRKCRRNGERGIDENSDSSSNSNCDICSVVPINHDAITLCNRFRTPSSLSQCATIGTSRDARNATSGDNTTADVNSVEVVEGQNIQTQGGRDQYNHLPVWRKRNLLHAQQHQQQQWQRHQKQLPLHEKENTSSSTDFATSGNKMINSRRGSNGRSALHASEGSPDRSFRQHRVVNPYQNMHKFSNYDKNTLSRTSFSATAHHQFDVINNGDSDLFYGATSGSVSPTQLPAHPRDAKRRSRSALKPITR